MINRQDSRHRIKRTNLTGVVPTAHTASTDFTDGTWLNTDIREAEFFYNIPDKKLWIGTGTSSIEIAQIGSTTSGNSLEQTLSIGNNSGTNNIIMGTATSIKSANFGGQIDLGFMSSFLVLSTDNGTLDESYIFLGTNSWYTGGKTSYLQGIADDLYLFTSGINNIIGNRVSIGGNGTVSISSSTGDIKLVTDTGKSVEISTGTSIKSENGGAAISLDTYGLAKNIFISNDGVGMESSIEMTPSSFSINNSTGNLTLSSSTYSISMLSNVEMSVGKLIKSASGGGQIDLDYMSSFLALSTDNGTFAESYIILGTNSWYTGSATNYLQGIAGNLYLATDGLNNITGSTIIMGANSELRVSTNNVFTLYGSFDSSPVVDVILVKDNFSTPSSSTLNDMPGVFIGSQNSTINAGVYNSVVLGGTGLTAISSNTVYVPDLRIQTGKSISFNYSTLTTDTVSTTTIGTFSIATITMVDDQSLSIRGQANGYCAYPNRNMGATFFASFIKYGGTIFQNGTTDIVLKDGYGDGTTPRVWTDGTNIFISIRTFSILTSKFTTSYEILST